MDPAPKTWPIGLVLGAMFCLFAGIWWITFTNMSAHRVRDVFDLTFFLFQGFWLLGWSVGVVILGLLTVLFLFAPATAASRAETVARRFRQGDQHLSRSGSSPLRPAERSSQRMDVAPLNAAPFIALIAANLTPLAGVLFFDWDLASVIILFWAESAIIGFYTILKLAIVGKIAAVFAVPFFIGHFGGFMTLHLLFIYMFFVRGLSAAGPDVRFQNALLATFGPIWISLAALFVSHGVSFFSNFIGRREYAQARTDALMRAPYSRIVVMQIVVIFGGWIVMGLGDPRPALALLVVAKTVADFAAHRKEHAGMLDR